MPSISTIIPVKNGEAFIADALDSICRQVIIPDEVLVVDDGLTDDTITIVEQFRSKLSGIKVLKGPQKGPGPARNVALEQATGEIITFLDADDVWPADKLRIQLHRLNKNPQVDVVSGFVRYFDVLDKNTLTPASNSRVNDIFHVHLGAAIFRRSIFQKLGHFHEDFLYSEDVDLILKIREADVPMTILRHITLFYRRHPDSMTTAITAEEAKSFNMAIMKSILRRRAAGITSPLSPFASLIEEPEVS